MSIEAGARAGLIVPDEKAFDYIRGRTYTPKGEQFEKMVDFWSKNLITDVNAKFDRDITLNVNDLVPQVSWGTNPSMVIDVTDKIPHPNDFAKGNENERKGSSTCFRIHGTQTRYSCYRCHNRSSFHRFMYQFQIGRSIGSITCRKRKTGIIQS